MSLQSDLERFDRSLRQFFQTIKRPSYWQAIASEAKLDCDRPGAAILMLLYHQTLAGHRVQDLAAHLQVEAPSITRKTQALEQAGLLRRRHSSTDKRSVELEITLKGKQLAERILKARQDYLGQLLADWPDSDRADLVKLFERFADQVDQKGQHD